MPAVLKSIVSKKISCELRVTDAMYVRKKKFLITAQEQKGRIERLCKIRNLIIYSNLAFCTSSTNKKMELSMYVCLLKLERK